MVLRTLIILDDKADNIVLVDGALIHRFGWKKGMTFMVIASYHVNYVRVNYGTCHVVFDGYNNRTRDTNEERIHLALIKLKFWRIMNNTTESVFFQIGRKKNN